MNRNEENPVNTMTARVELGKPGKPWGAVRMSAIKKAMGTTHHSYIFLSDVRAWLRVHPDFKERDAYPRKPKPEGEPKPLSRSQRLQEQLALNRKVA